jgi:hypothetical protein
MLKFPLKEIMEAPIAMASVAKYSDLSFGKHLDRKETLDWLASFLWILVLSFGLVLMTWNPAFSTDNNVFKFSLLELFVLTLLTVFGAISFGAALSSVVHLIRWKKVSLLAFEQVFLRIVTNTLILSFFSNIFLAGWALWDQGNVTNIHDKELEMVKLTLMTVGIIALIFSTIFYLKSNKKNLKSIQLNVVGLIALVVCAINLFITIWIIQPENNLQISF